MHSTSMASNLNHSIRSSSSNSPLHGSSKEQPQDYLPDSLKHVFDQVKKQIEKASLEDFDDDDHDNDHDDDHDDEKYRKKKLNSSIVTDASDPFYASMLSPESDIAGPFDTAMGSACRRNPAELYKTTAEAMEQALDDKPGVCPDHEDDCQCHLISSVFPVFNLEAALNKCQVEDSPTANENKADSDKAPLAKDQNDCSSPNVEDFLPQDDDRLGNSEFSQDTTDLSYHDDYDGPPLEYSPNDNTSFDGEKEEEEEEEDILDFLPNDVNQRNISSSSSNNNNNNNNNNNRNTSVSNSVSAKESNVKQTSPKRGKFLGKNRQQSQGQPKHRIFNISIPKSPRMIRRSRQSVQYASLDDPMKRTRMDVPLTIELRNDNLENRTSKINNIKNAPPGKERRKRLTIPKTPKLLTKQKRGDRRYSSVGLSSKEKDDDDDARCMKQSLLQGNKRSLTVPKEPKLYSKEKLGERRYSSIGKEVKEEEGVARVDSRAASRSRPLTRPKSPTLVLTEKFGERRYSTVGLGRSDTNCEDGKEKKELVVTSTKPTVPKTPRLSFFMKKANKMANNTTKSDDSAPVRKQETSSVRNGSNRILSSRPLTVPQPFHLATNDRAQSARRSSKVAKDCSDGTDINEHASVGENKKEYVFRARPVPNFSRTSSMTAKSKLPVRPLTVPLPFHLATDERALSPRRSTKELKVSSDGSWTKEGSDVSDNKKEYVFHARPVPDFSRIPFNKPQVRPLTVPQPFHLVTNDRAHSPRRSVKGGKDCSDSSYTKEGSDVSENRKGYVFRARPAPDFSRSSLVRSKAPVRPLTVPQPFHLATDERALSPRRSTKALKACSDGSWTKEGSYVADDTQVYVFHARPVPDFSRIPFSKPQVRPLTVPQPFHLATNDRAHTPRRSNKEFIDGGAVSWTNEGVEVVEYLNEYVFRARPVPDFSRARTSCMTAKSKAPVRPLTVPQPFRLATDERALSPRRSAQAPKDCGDGVCIKEGSYVSEDKKDYVFRARPVPDFSRTMFATAKNKTPMRPLTVPQPFNLATSQRPSIKLHPDSVNCDIDASYLVEEKYISCSRKLPNFSRNPNAHRKALVRRSSIGKTPFRILNNCHKPEQTTHIPQVQSKESTATPAVALDENRFVPQGGSSSCQQNRAKHEDLRQKLNKRARQNAVARAEQYDETLNTVTHFIEKNSQLLSSVEPMRRN